MNKMIFTALSFFLISSLSFAELKLNLPTNLTGETTQSIIDNNLKSNLKLAIPAEVVPSADLKEFVKGMILLGILADVSIPMGSDDGFKHIAEPVFPVTQWGHIFYPHLSSYRYELVTLNLELKRKKDRIK